MYMKTHTPYIPCCSSRGENEEKTAEREIYISQILYSAQIFLWQQKKKPLYRASFITYRVYSYLIFYSLYPIWYKIVIVKRHLRPTSCTRRVRLKLFCRILFLARVRSCDVKPPLHYQLCNGFFCVLSLRCIQMNHSRIPPPRILHLHVYPPTHTSLRVR